MSPAAYGQCWLIIDGRNGWHVEPVTLLGEGPDAAGDVLVEYQTGPHATWSEWVPQDGLFDDREQAERQAVLCALRFPPSQLAF